MRRLSVAALLAALVLAASPAGAVSPSEMLANPALEARAEGIGYQLRCLVCQNESIEESGADLAHDLRVLLRQRLSAGDTDQQAIAFLVARYGDYVLLKPPLKTSTLLLWLGPPALLLIGALSAWLFLRRRPSIAARPLDEAEAGRVAALLREDHA